jgi:hypothetical protein
MEGERVTDSVWFKCLRAKYPKTLLLAVKEELYVCIPQTCSLSSSAISAASVGELNFA